MSDLPTMEECNKAISNPEYEIGKGKDRRAFRVPGSKWVYKVADYYDTYTNPGEIERYTMLMNNPDLIPEGLHFPEMHLMENGVVAAQFIDGDRARNQEEKEIATQFADNIGWHDSSAYCNTRVTVDSEGNKKLYIIDLGE